MIININGVGSLAPLSISGVAAQTAPIAKDGMYHLMATTTCYLKIDSDASDVTAAVAGGGFPLLASNGVLFPVKAGDRIGAITTGGTGILEIYLVGGLVND